MNYYTLPKIYNNNIIINPIENTEELIPYVSNNLFYHYNDIYNRISKDEMTHFKEMKKNINTNEYIFSRVSFSKNNLCKLKSKTQIFYDFLEITTIITIFDDSYNTNSNTNSNTILNTLHFGKNDDTIECLKMIRKNYTNKINISYFEKIITDISEKDKYNFIFFASELNEAEEIENDEYYIFLIKILITIFKNQHVYGSCIIQINEIFYKPVIDFLYILSSIYSKIYVTKPNTSNITTYEKYIICKNFYIDESVKHIYENNTRNLLTFLTNKKGKIQSILDIQIPRFFLTKIEEINIIIGQQQIDALDMIINLLKNKSKNKEEKIEIIKKNCVQKTIIWCEKINKNQHHQKNNANIFLPKEPEVLPNITPHLN